MVWGARPVATVLGRNAPRCQPTAFPLFAQQHHTSPSRVRILRAFYDSSHLLQFHWWHVTFAADPR